MILDLNHIGVCLGQQTIFLHRKEHTLLSNKIAPHFLKGEELGIFQSLQDEHVFQVRSKPY